MALTTKVQLDVAAKQTGTLDLGSSAAQIAKTYSVSLADGTAAGQADRMFSDTRTLAASATEDLDLAGVLTDAFGATLTFAKVKAIIISAAAGNTNNVIVGGASATQFASWVGAATHTVTLRPGATLALFAGAADDTGYVSAAGSTDLLKIANSGAGTSVSYDIVLVGTSA
jgi:hypothetical protein